MKRWIWVLPAAGAVAVGARLTIDLPGEVVDTTLQTLAVFLAGGVLGPWRGMASVALYLALGAAGLPVFSDGGAGVDHLFGPTAGYLFGFIGCAGWMGAAGARGWDRTFAGALAAALLATAAVLAVGAPVLAWRTELGMLEALQVGALAPLPGGLVKAVVVAGALWAWRRWGPAGAPPNA